MVRTMRLPTACILLSFLVPPAFAQAPPATDVWLVPLAGGVPVVAGAVNLTDRDGYDNQPSFTPDGAGLLYTSFRDGQTDIFRYDLAAGAARPLTHTPESEYSPTVMPGGEAFSVVRVEADGTQRLWAFALDGTAPRLLLPDVRPVGYHAWADARTVVLFVLGTPPTLQRARLDGGRPDTLVFGIGRSLQPLPGGVGFVYKVAEGHWSINRLDLNSGAIRPLAPTRPGREDFARHPDGTLLMADGAVLYAWDGAAWQPLADFSPLGLTELSRLAVSPGGHYLAFVAAREDAP